MSSADQPGQNLLTPDRAEWEADPVNATLEAYEDQLPFLAADKRYHAFISGIGAGKTNGLIQRALLNVHYWNPGETGMLVAPTVPSLRNVILPELRKWNVLNTCEYRASEKTLVWPNGSRVILESADNDRKIDRLRGPSIAWAGLDEPATVSKRAWDILVGRLRTGQYRNAFVTGTPKGYNWVYERFHPEGDRFTDDVNPVLNVPTTANPHTPDDYRQEIVEEYEGSFYEQEVLGSFVKFEGLVYPWFDEDNQLPYEDLPSVEDLDRVIYGVDWGFKNPSVILAIGVQGDSYYVFDEFYERRCTTDVLSETIQQMQDRYRPGPIFCDPSEPADIQELQNDGLDARKAMNDVTPGIKKVSSRSDSLYVSISCQNLINEFGMYQYKNQDGTDDVLKKNDHACDSLRYALLSYELNDDVKHRTTRRTGGSIGSRTITHPQRQG